MLTCFLAYLTLGRFRFQVLLHAKHLPKSIQTIWVLNVKEVAVAEDAFSKLHSLKSIHLTDIGTLRVAKNNWSQIARPEQVRITVQRVFYLAVHSGAFYGLSDPGPKISISDVSKCFIAKDVFGPDSAFRRVLLQNIDNLTLNSSAFRAKIDRLKLDNVSLATPCRSGSFRGRIRNLLLRSVRISDVRGGCLHARDGWGSLTVHSSTLENIHPFGFNGRVNHVVIEESRVGRVTGEGLHLRDTITFRISSTAIRELASDALDVNFNQSVALKNSSIDTLRTNAFRRLEALAGDRATLTIQRVTLNEAEDGSLTFPGQTRITRLDVVLREPCDCNVDERALRLAIGDTTPRNATEPARMVGQIVDQVRCTAGPVTPTLAEFLSLSCSAQGENGARRSSLATRVVVRDWVLPVSVSTSLLALALFCVVVLLVNKRLGRRREEHPKAPEPEYSEIPGNVQPSERHAASTVGESSSTDQALHGTHDLQPVYSELNAPALPRPPSSVCYDVMPRVVLELSRRLGTGQPGHRPPSSPVWKSSRAGLPPALPPEPDYSEILPRPPSTIGPGIPS